MSLTWRIQTVFDDRSQRSIASAASGTGATVVAGSRSVEEPILFAKGETQRMLNLFGAPTRQDQGLLEAIEFNKSYPLYCVGPALTKKFNYIIFRKTESEEGSSGITPDTPPGYLTSQEVDANGMYNCGVDFTGSPLTCRVPANVTLSGLQFYHSTEAGGTVTNTPIEGVTVSSSQISGTLTGTVSAADEFYTLTLSEVGSYTGQISVRYSMTMGDDVYLILVQRGSGNFVQGSLSKNKLRKTSNDPEIYSYYLTLSFNVLNYLNNYQKAGTVNFSLERGAVDGFQRALNAETRFANNDYFKAIYNPKVQGDTSLVSFPNATEETDVWAFNLQNVSRGFSTDNGPLADTDISGGYSFYHKTKDYQPDLFFDATGSSIAVSALEEIRNNYHPYSRVLVPLYTDDPEDASDALEKINSIPANRGFSAYWGEFEINNPYSYEYPTFQGVPMGSIAVRHSDSISLSYGGRAVAWIDENGVGGQLSGSRLIRGLADPSQEELKTLDEGRVNAVIYDDTYGPMILSRRTTYSDYSDYSFNDYSGVIDYCIKNIVKNALPYQIVKFNDPAHRSIVRTRIDSILSPLTVAPNNVLAAYAIKCDSENNNEEAKQNEEFRVSVCIQVTAKSRTIVLNFINAGQTMTVEEAIAA